MIGCLIHDTTVFWTLEQPEWSNEDNVRNNDRGEVRKRSALAKLQGWSKEKAGVTAYQEYGSWEGEMQATPPTIVQLLHATQDAVNSLFCFGRTYFICSWVNVSASMWMIYCTVILYHRHRRKDYEDTYIIRVFNKFLYQYRIVQYHARLNLSLQMIF